MDKKPVRSRRIALRVFLSGLLLLLAGCTAATSADNSGTLLSAADAQMQPPSGAVTKFDGIYAFVSATKMYDAYHSSRLTVCPDIGRAQSLIIVNGRVQYYHSKFPFRGTVGPQGELVMRYAYVTKGGGYERFIFGHVDDTGTIRAHKLTSNCNYDMMWRKRSE